MAGIQLPINEQQIGAPFQFAMERPQYSYLWIVVFSSILAFASALAMGSNDVSSSFATTVGSRALNIRQALIISAIFQILGAYFLGARVVKTVGRAVTNLDAYEFRGDLLMVGMMVVLIMTSIAVLLATYKGFPISTTQCIISTIVGFALASPGNAVNWNSVYTIIGGWLAAPVLGAMTSATTFALVRTLILRHPQALRRTFLLLPVLTWLTVALNLFFVLFVSPIASRLGLSVGPGIGICLAIGAVVGIVLFLLRFKLEARVLASRQVKSSAETDVESKAIVPINGLMAGTTNPLHMRADMFVYDAALEDEFNGLTAEELNEPDSDRYVLTKTLMETFSKANKYLSKLDPKERNEVMHKEIQRVVEHHETVRRGGRRMSVDAVASFVSFEKQQKYFDEAEKKNANMHDRAEQFDPVAEEAFKYLQIFTSVVAAFAQGANSIGNITGPLSVVVGIYIQGGSIKGEMNVEEWVTWLGIAGLLTGLFGFGYIVLTSVGVKMIHVSPSRGFSIGFAASLMLAIGSFIGLPLSTTHCTIGAIVGVGLVEKPFLEENEKDKKLTILESIKRAPVNWKFLAQVVAAWFVTVAIGLVAGSTIFSFATFSPSQIIPMNANNCVVFYGVGRNVTGPVTIDAPADGFIRGLVGFSNLTVVPI